MLITIQVQQEKGSKTGKQTLVFVSPPLTCTVAVKGMTVFKEVHAKQVHKGIVKVHKEKISKMCICKQ